MNAVIEVLSLRIAGNHVQYEGESDLHLLPTLRSAWMLSGTQPRVPAPSTNQKKSVFGALDTRMGVFIHRIFDRKRGSEFSWFLEHVINQYPTGSVDIVLDNPCAHKARSFRHGLPAVKGQLMPSTRSSNG